MGMLGVEFLRVSPWAYVSTNMLRLDFSANPIAICRYGYCLHSCPWFTWSLAGHGAEEPLLGQEHPCLGAQSGNASGNRQAPVVRCHSRFRRIRRPGSRLDCHLLSCGNHRSSYRKDCPTPQIRCHRHRCRQHQGHHLPPRPRRSCQKQRHFRGFSPHGGL